MLNSVQALFAHLSGTYTPSQSHSSALPQIVPQESAPTGSSLPINPDFSELNPSSNINATLSNVNLTQI